MLTKRVVLGKLELLEDEQLQVREDTIIEDDGVEVARTYHRYVLVPGTDVTTKDARVQKVTAAMWSPEVVKSYQDDQARRRVALEAALTPVDSSPTLVRE